MRILGEEVPWRTITAVLAARARQHGDAARVDVDGTRTSWGELDRLSDRVAAGLAAEGVGLGDRVCSLMDGRVEALLVWFATNKLGAIWAPLNSGLVGDDLAYTVRDAGPKVLVAERETAARVADLPAEVLPSRLFCTEPGIGGRFAPFEDLLSGPAGAPADPGTGPVDPAVIIYTGGTTGRPKGAVMPHFAFLAAGYRARDAFGIVPEDRQMSVLPLYHVGGTMLGIMGPLVADIPTALERRFSATRFWDRARRTGATLVDPVGTMVSLLCQAPAGPGDRTHPVRASVGVTGQVAPEIPETFRSRFGVDLVNLYSLTEAGGVLITYTRPDGPNPRAHGEPGRWADYRVVDAFDQDRPAGETGEIVLRPRVPFTFMLGYHNDPARTVQTWTNLWLHTGDLGRIDADGCLHFVGRQAHWLRCRGENVSAYEVEAVVGAHPGVREAAVVGVPAELGEDDVKAFVVLEEGAGVGPESIVAWCAARLARFKVPRYVAFVPALPRSATKQEVERHKLRALGNDGNFDAKAAPREDRA